MTAEKEQPVPPRSYLLLILLFSGLKLLLHFLANSNYGLHSDELYYISLGKHLQWGYLDNGPFTPAVAAFIAQINESSTFLYRLLPTIFSAATVCLAGLASWYLGGGRLAIAISCTAMLCSPAYLATGYFLQPVAFEQFFWTAGAFFLLRFFQTQRLFLLLIASASFACGTLNKYSVIVYFVALVAGLLIYNRKDFKPAAIWAVIAAGLLIIPNLMWQINNDLPFLRYLTVLKEKTVEPNAGEFLLQQLLAHGSGLAVWSAGLISLLFWPALRRYRFLAFATLLIIAFFTISGGKIYYTLGAFPLLFAAGSVCWEKLLCKAPRFWTYNLFCLHLLPVLVALPAIIPVLPLHHMFGYFKAVAPYTAHTALLEWPDGNKHDLPAFYADMLGWPELSAQVDSAYKTLNQTQKNDMMIVTDGYAVTAALSHFKKPDLPAVHTCDNSITQWSAADPESGNVLLITCKSQADVSRLARKTLLLNTFTQPHAIGHGTKTYLLIRPLPAFSDWYKSERKKFVGR
ncbi:glycosyltransferase family 39 protein [Pedobacter sp. SYP-B3415]|uniref:ArnT family glycosyltransferase n=1 Tax=Pedobacter sp. SYP-B3415 TaxID=2496641 RepID=UPI00101DF160|nr:glycosyltransferase family 39 protein [Pedobacter sp. SYP-B3415]